MKFRLLLPLAVALHFIGASDTRAAWPVNGAPVSTTVSYQFNSSIISDGAGGAILTWMDARSSGYDIYAQRIDTFGNALWTKDGVAVCVATGTQSFPTLIADGAGGAIITWHDSRSGVSNDVYAQRVNGSGVVQWTANGVAVCTATNDQTFPKLVPDGTGGAIVVWDDVRGGVTADIYAQRINSAGTAQWTANGIALCAAANNQDVSGIMSDGAGGAIAVWTDYRTGTNNDIYTQRVNSSGAAQWAANGVALCASTGEQTSPSITADGAGGAIATWTDTRNGPTSDIYAQRINASGAVQWTVNGTVVCAAASYQSAPSIVLDGAGGVIIAWGDLRGTDQNIYAQRVSLAGTVQWAADGVAVSTAPGNQDVTAEVPDGAGGAIITWSDPRAEPTGGDIYAQHVDVSGMLQWTYDGVLLCNSPSGQYDPRIVADGSGNAIVAWGDLRGGAGYDVYAQRVEGTYGFWGHPEPTITTVKDVPHDQGGKVAVNWKASGRDIPVPETISYYTIWRAVDVLPASVAAGSSSLVKRLSDVREDATGPVFIAALSPSQTHGRPSEPSMTPIPNYYWELVGTQSARAFGGYTYSAPTRADSVLASAANEVFMVAAHGFNDDIQSFPSSAVTGHSVDNLAPIAPLALTAQRIGNYVHLKWNGVHVADIKNYTVYRATSSGVTPLPPNFLANESDTLLTDASAPASALYYIVTANDVHQNQSTKSNEASVAAATGVGNLPPITALTVLQNSPNPFSSETKLQIGLPARSEVRVDIYDVAGRRVRNVLVRAREKGWDTLRISARDDRGAALPSGVYFYKVHAGAETVTKKMVIAR